jgi:ABC-2 type transport system ATP-binding protein
MLRPPEAASGEALLIKDGGAEVKRGGIAYHRRRMRDDLSKGKDAVHTEELGHDYGSRTALQSLDLAVPEGAVLALLGPNGGGKTTLFRILATLLRPTRGRAFVFGCDVVRRPDAVRRAMGVVFQAPALDRLLTVRENLEVQGKLYGLSGGPLREAMREALLRLGLQGREQDRVGTLSGGLARRVEIAKSLLHRPRLLLLDEPSTGLDPAARGALGEHLRERARTDGVTVVLTTHILEEADGADRVAILDAGRLVASGPPAALKEEIGGQVILLRPRADLLADASALARLRDAVTAVCGQPPDLLEGILRLESPQASHLVQRLTESLADRFDSVTVARPTLLDVFVRRTGRRFAAPPDDDRFPGERGAAA